MKLLKPLLLITLLFPLNTFATRAWIHDIYNEHHGRIDKHHSINGGLLYR